MCHLTLYVTILMCHLTLYVTILMCYLTLYVTILICYLTFSNYLILVSENLFISIPDFTLITMTLLVSYA